MALGHYKASRADFAYVCRARPTDKDARGKLAEADRQHKRVLFEEAIASETERPPSARMDPAAIGAAVWLWLCVYGSECECVVAWRACVRVRVRCVVAVYALFALMLRASVCARACCAAVPSSYTGPHMGDVITPEFVEAMVSEFKAQRLIHKMYALRLLLTVKPLFAAAPSLVQVRVRACV